MKKWIIFAVAAVIALTMVAAWSHWRSIDSMVRTEKLMVRAKNTDRHFYNEIVVREIMGAPVDDSACYQCEFRRPGVDRPWSYQTYAGASFRATRARIVWANENEATVFLDDYPVFKCVDGWWTRP